MSESFTISVLPIGATVSIGGNDAVIRGIITSINIFEGNIIQYKVAWWDGRNRKEEWMGPKELAPCHDYHPLKIRIGF